jgi:plastocyanin
MRALLLAFAVAALGAAPAQAQPVVVTMPAKLFSPAQVTAVAGDELVFRNSDFTGDAHNVRADDGSFDSGPMPRYATFRTRVDAVRTIDFVCTIHPGMSGQAEVVGALLVAPPEPGLAGEELALAGRVPAGTPHAEIEHQAADGSWMAAGHAMAEPDGTFVAHLRPTESGSYRAVAASGTSAPVEVRVLTAARIATRVRRGRLSARVSPAPAGVWAVLERYVRERFSWRPVARVRLTGGRASFRAGRRGIARVVLERRRGAPALATSAAVRLRDGRRAADPTAGDMPAGDHAGHPG